MRTLIPFLALSLLVAGCSGASTPPLPTNLTNGQPTGAGQVGAPSGIRAANGGGELALGNNRPGGPIATTRVQ